MVFRLFSRKKRLFGAPLEIAIAKSPLGDGLPLPLSRGIDFIEAKAMKMEGLYRVSGSHKAVNELQKLYDRGKDPDLSEFEPFVVTGLFKKYLTLLPEPVMTFSLYDSFLAASRVRNKNERIRSIKQLVKELPQQNYTVLERIVRHLIKVSEHHEENKMGIANLAIVFGPTLFRLRSENPMRVLTDAPVLSACVQIFIREYGKVFGDEPIVDDSEQDGTALSSWERIRRSRKSRRGTRDSAIARDRSEQPNHFTQQTSESVEEASDQHAERIRRSLSNQRIRSFRTEGDITLQPIKMDTASRSSDDESGSGIVVEEAEAIGNTTVEVSSGSAKSDDGGQTKKIEVMADEIRKKSNEELVSQITKQAADHSLRQHSSLSNFEANLEVGTAGSNATKICQSSHSEEKSERHAQYFLLLGNEWRRTSIGSSMKNVLYHFWHDNTPIEQHTCDGTPHQQQQRKLRRISIGVELRKQLRLIATETEFLENPVGVISKRLELMRSNLNFSTADLDSMSHSELEVEHRLLKRELRTFDKVFEQCHGRPPAKTDKEVLRPFYMRYRRASAMVDKFEQSDDSSVDGALCCHTSLEPNGELDQEMDCSAAAAAVVAGQRCEGIDLDQGVAGVKSDKRQLRRNKSSIRLSYRLSEILEDDAEWLEMMIERRKLQSKLLEYQREFVMKYGRKPHHGPGNPLRTEYERYMDLKAQMRNLIAKVENELTMATSP